MIQVFVGHANTVSTGTYYPFVNLADFSSTYLSAAIPITVAGTFRNMRVRIATAPGSGQSRSVTLYKNGAATALIVTIAGAAGFSGENSTDEVTVVVGDTVAIRMDESHPGVSGTPNSEVVYCLEFESDVASECVYGAGCQLNTTHQGRQGLFGGSDDWVSEITDRQNVIPLAGTITRWDVQLEVAPGAGASKTFTIYKNSVAQDGTGGTPDTTIVISDAATTGTASFSLALAVGDLVWAQCDHVNTPAAGTASLGVKFVSSSTHEFIICGAERNVGQTGTGYFNPSHCEETIPRAESICEAPGPITPILLTGIILQLGLAPGPVSSRTFSARRNQTSPSGTPAVTISGATDTQGSAAGSLALTSDVTWSVQSVPVNEPAIANCAWAFVGTTELDEGDDVIVPGGVIGPLVWVHCMREVTE